MASSSFESATFSSDNFYRHRATAIASMVVISGLFVAAALMGEAVTDEGLKTVLRFISLTLLATAIFSGAAVSLHYSNRTRRRIAGMVAACGMSVGAGLIWTVTSVFAGFWIYMSGCLLALLLITQELNASLKRRRSKAA